MFCSPTLSLPPLEKPTPAKVAEHQQPLKPHAGQVPPIVGAVAVGPVPGAGVPAGPPQGPPIPAPGVAPGSGYGMYPFYGQSPYMMGGQQQQQQQDPLTGKPLPGGPPGSIGSQPPSAAQPPTQGPLVQAGAVQQQQTGGPGQPPVNLCDYNKGAAKEPPPLDLMTKPPVDLMNAVGPTGAPGVQQSQQHQQLLGQGPPQPGPPSSVGSGEPTSPMKDYPGGLSAAALAAQQHHHQQAKVLSHYYPYK